MDGSDGTTKSSSYLLQLWKEQGISPSWRFSLESVQGGRRRGFGSLQSLVAFLEQEMDGRTIPDVMDKKGRPAIERFLQQIVPSLKEEDIHAFCAQGISRRVFTGQEVVRAGDICEEVLFVHWGTFRIYLRSGGREHTRDFSRPDSMYTAYTSLVTCTPSQLSLTAVEDAEVTAWPAGYLLPLFETSLPWQTFARRLAESQYLRAEQRELSLLLDGAQERYERFLAEFPEVAHLQAAPPWIASYLDLTPQMLSRLSQQLRRPS